MLERLEQLKAIALMVSSWAIAHPVIAAYIVGTLVTAVLKPRTPDQFAAMPYWKASLLKLAGALFTDPAKAQQAILAILLRKPLEATFCTKTREPKDPNEPHDTDPPDPPGLLAVPLSPSVPILALAAMLVACGPVEPGARSPARDYARAGLALIAEAQKEADHVCAELARAKQDANLAKTCANAYDLGRASLLAGQSTIDAWDSANQGDVLCAAGGGVSALKSVAAAVSAAGGPAMPPIVQDALSLGSQLSAGCKGGAK